MAVISNKDIVAKLYQAILNKKQFGILDQFVDRDYIETFSNGNKPMMFAFPDIQFDIKEIFEAGNKVITLYDWTGTHQNEYQKIPATTKKITVEGISIYEFKDGKIINSIAKPDKLSFFLQLGVISEDFKKKKTVTEEWVYSVDEFEVPRTSYDQFKEKLDYHRRFIKKIEGFIKDEVLININKSSDYTIITIAVWENEQRLFDARKSVQNEYTSIGFEPIEFNKELNIQMKRETYSPFE